MASLVFVLLIALCVCKGRIARYKPVKLMPEEMVGAQLISLGEKGQSSSL